MNPVEKWQALFTLERIMTASHNPGQTSPLFPNAALFICCPPFPNLLCDKGTRYSLYSF